jgi:hypothetical protein
MKNKGFLGVGRNAYHRWCQKIEKNTQMWMVNGYERRFFKKFEIELEVSQVESDLRWAHLFLLMML